MHMRRAPCHAGARLPAPLASVPRRARGKPAVAWIAVGDRIDRLPLFPLPMVLLPSEVAPLHIFEERYKLMIGECLDEGRELGILWLSDDGLRDVGCTATVTRLLERMDDGRMNILIEGARAFRLVQRIDDLPYPAGDVELLDEDEREPANDEASAEARDRYADLVARVTDSRPEDDELEGLDAYRMAATVDFALDAKQKLLELRSERDRLRMVAELFGSTVKRLDHFERMGELAKTNGRIRS